MDPYHGKVCSQAHCCRAKYECYGNCGDYGGLYIFLGFAALLLAGIAWRVVRQRRAVQPQLGAALTTDCLSPSKESGEP